MLDDTSYKLGDGGKDLDHIGGERGPALQ